MLPPELTSVTDLSRQLGVTTGTLYSWKNKHQSQGSSMTLRTSKVKKWTAKDKLAVIIETASLNEIEISECCRNKLSDGERKEVLGYCNCANWRKESDVWNIHFKQPYSEITGALMSEAVVGDMDQYMNFVTEIV